MKRASHSVLHGLVYLAELGVALGPLTADPAIQVADREHIETAVVALSTAGISIKQSHDLSLGLLVGAPQSLQVFVRQLDAALMLLLSQCSAYYRIEAAGAQMSRSLYDFFDDLHVIWGAIYACYVGYQRSASLDLNYLGIVGLRGIKLDQIRIRMIFEQNDLSVFARF